MPIEVYLIVQAYAQVVATLATPGIPAADIARLTTIKAKLLQRLLEAV